MVEHKPSLGDFHIVKTLGRGAFGIVYMARHKPTDNLVALKQISKEVLIKFRKQASVMREKAILQ